MGNTETKTTGAVPLTTDKVVEVLMHVKVESKRFLKRRMIREIFRISDFKSNEIIQGCKSDEKRLKKLVEYWLVMCPYASWRWLIWYLDLNEYHDIVDQISQFAEPLNIPSLTLSNVSKVLHPLTTYLLNMCLGVSDGGMLGVRKKIWSQSESEEQYREGLISWWLLTSPFAAWEFLAEALYSLRGEGLSSARQLVMKHIKHTPEPTLTVDNLKSVLEIIPDHAYVKDHKRTKWSYTMGTFKAHLTPNVDAFLEYKSAFVAQYLTEHPAPSWKLVAHAVYCRCEYGVLEIIHKKYLNSSVVGGSCDSVPESDKQVETPPSPIETATKTGSSGAVTEELCIDNVVNFLLQHVRVPEHEGLDTRIWKCPRYIGIKVLYLSLFLVDEILSMCTYNEREQVEKLVSFWLLKCPLASWRWLIWRLEECSLSEAAKVIQPYAETLTDPTLTLDSVAAVLKDQSINQVRPCLKVPILVQYRLETQNKSEDQLKVTLSEWWLASSPFAAWDLLAADVENTSDMETVRSRLPKTAPASLSLQNLNTVFKETPDSDIFHSVLCTLVVPDKTVDYLFLKKEQQHPHLTQKQATIQFFFDAYGSSLSWRLIAYKIYAHERRKEEKEYGTSSDSCTRKYSYELITTIQRSFLNGSSLQDLCVEAVSNSMATVEDVQLLPLPNKIKVLVELAMIA